VLTLGTDVWILQTRYPLQNGDPPGGLYRFTSTDRGATFGAAEQAGTLDMYDAVLGLGNMVWGVTDSSAQGGAFQSLTLSGTPPGSALLTQLWGGDHPYGGSIGLIDIGTPLVIYANGSGAAQFRRYSGSGDYYDAANWTPAADIGSVSYPHLAGGPSGLFLITTNPDHTLVSRKWDGTTFGPDVAISAGASAPSTHAFEDAGGRLHVVFERDGQGADLIHAVSDDGTTWRSGTVTTATDPGDSFGDTRVAAAPDHIGVVVWRGVANGVAQIRVEAVGPDAPVAPDTTPPETELKQGPKQVETGKPKATVKFTFTSSEPGSTFECRLDKKPFKPCTSPKKLKVKPGKHRFTVQAVDAAGNPDPQPATFKFKVVRK
jgi:hypothetical protein